MFWDDIKLVTEQVEKYGLCKPFADLGGMERPCIADYDLTIATGDQFARYVGLNQRPFDHIDPDYLILNPEKGDPFIEDLPYTYQNAFGTAVCLNVLEHVENPFRVFAALYQIMKSDGLLILETVFSFPYHPSPLDYWRYSPDCIRHLSEHAGFTVIECDWRTIITAEKGIRTTAAGIDEPQEIRSVYATLTKGQNKLFGNYTKYVLPKRLSNNQSAQRIIEDKSESKHNIVSSTYSKHSSKNDKLDLLTKHSLIPDDKMMQESCDMLGLTSADLSPSSREQITDLLIGEYYAHLSNKLGYLASELLYKAQWTYTTPEWFDHRHHFLDPNRFGGDYWALSADLVLLKLPLNGRILDLCSGDGYYDYHFYAHRASEVVAVEIHPQAYQQALRHHCRPNITYINSSIFDFAPQQDYFDVVVIRGAIEHFTAVDQQRIFKMAMAALKPGGWFCGDTPANLNKNVKQLDSHENEWTGEEEMRHDISQVFPQVDTLTYSSHQRVTLFWQAQKKIV